MAERKGTSIWNARSVVEVVWPRCHWPRFIETVTSEYEAGNHTMSGNGGSNPPRPLFQNSPGRCCGEAHERIRETRFYKS